MPLTGVVAADEIRGGLRVPAGDVSHVFLQAAEDGCQFFAPSPLSRTTQPHFQKLVSTSMYTLSVRPAS